MRACSDVKHNFVIGRSGKGYATHVAFDLDDAMGESSCVSCGECMVSCPTGALVFKGTVAEDLAGPGEERVSPDDLGRYPIFKGVPPKFLAWNGGAVTRRRFAPGEVICREGEYASTAFLIVRGRVGVSVGGKRAGSLQGGMKAFVRKATRWLQGSRLKDGEAVEPRRPTVNIDGGRSLRLEEGRWVDEMTSEDVIFGEMSCLNHYPRSATVVAIEATELLEIHRNVLHMLQRNEASRRILDDAYRSRSLARELRQLSMFQGLSEADRARCAEWLRDRAEIVRVDRGQPIFRQGDVAADFYKVRLGFVKVSQRLGDQDRTIDYLGPGRSFGEIGLVSSMEDFGEDLSGSGNARARRTATCTALDDVELVRIRGEDFRALVREFPAASGSCTACIEMLP